MPILNDDEQRDKLDEAMAAFRFQVVLITNRMLAGDLGAQEWRVLFELEVRYLQVIAAVLAAGSYAALTPELQRLVLEATEKQLGFFRSWSAAAQAPTPARSDAQILARAVLYAGAGVETYSRVRTRALGLPDLPVYPKQRSQCNGGCLCHWRIVQLDDEGDWDCFWIITAEESCDTCKARAIAFSPMRIRGGVILPYPRGGIYV